MKNFNIAKFVITKNLYEFPQTKKPKSTFEKQWEKHW
jgi:hypothetical protein